MPAPLKSPEQGFGARYSYSRIPAGAADVTMIKNPRIIPELIDQLDILTEKNWDMLFTDLDYRQDEKEYIIARGAAERPDMDCSLKERYSSKYTSNKKISPDFRRITARFGTHSMIIRREGIKKLYQFALKRKIFLPYDQENYLAPGIRRYSFNYDVVSNIINGLTDNVSLRYEDKENGYR